MRKYNTILVVSVFVYLVLALAAVFGVGRLESEKDNQYKIEINRTYHSLSTDFNLDKLDLRSCKYLKEVSCLPASRLEDEREADNFYQADNHLAMEIRPLFIDNDFYGLLRFDYEAPLFKTQSILIFIQVCLALMEIFVIGVLLYLKYQIIRPFSRLNRLPRDLAEGHLNSIVTEEKSRFFGQFIWGIGQLKDALYSSRKRQLELEMEKKKMLLSLSHDIKTPLNNIKLYAKALEQNLYEDESKRLHAARQIGEKAGQIESYVEEIIHNSREDILDIEVRYSEFYLADLIKRVLDTYEEKCRLRLVELHVGPYENLLLKGDLERTVEIFENLFENALKYGDGRKIEISFYEEDYCPLIRVFNTGNSVTDNDFNHLFESFYRGANSDGTQGNGLGLYICQEIMRKMHGEIFAQREEEGMAFVLVFTGD